MKKTFLSITVIGLLFTTLAKAQEKDTVQPDSLYRKYHIRARSGGFEGAQSKAKEIFLFDPQGRYAGFALTDNETGTRLQDIYHYTYNDKNILKAENDTIYDGDKYAVERGELLYNADGTLQKETIKSGDNIISEVVYSPAERKETETLYRYGQPYRVQTAYNDEHGKMIRFTGDEKADTTSKPRVITVNGKTFTINPQRTGMQWDYRFENVYDEQGRLIEKKRSKDNGPFQSIAKYTYDERGLLQHKIEHAFGHEQITDYEYAYY